MPVAQLADSIYEKLDEISGKSAPTLKVSDLYPKVDIEDRARAYLDTIEASVSGQEGSKKTFGAVCRVGPGFDLAPDVALRLIRDHYNPRCQPPWIEKELTHKVEDAYRSESRRGWLLDQKPNQNGHHAILKAADKDPINLTDLGNARRLVMVYGNDIHHVFPWVKWLTWESKGWKPDDSGHMQEFSQGIATAMYREADKNGTIDQALAKWALKSESRERLEAMISVARSLPGIPILPKDLNADPWLLNVENGTIELKTGRLREHRRQDLITALAPVRFDENAVCPIWEGMLSHIFCDPEMVRFWQQLCGICLTGSCSEQILPILYGGGANGKSTILGVLLEILGPDYAVMAPPGLLMVQRGEHHPTERAVLFGKRLVVDMESAEGAKMNESIVKQLTGSDRISARRMREDFWDFAPTHKIMMCTNHKPTISETKGAIWRRIKLIPFTVTIPEDQQVKDLPEQLRTEYPGILAWCVRGCLDWQKNKLIVPDEVKGATQEYREEQDIFAGFFAQECLIAAQARAKASKLYDRYRTYCTANGEQPISLTAFGVAIRERGFDKKENHGIWYIGIGLREKVPSKSDTQKVPY